jgi:hypothetical protein
MPKGKGIESSQIEALEKKYGTKPVPGKISGTKGKYYLSYGGKRKRLDPKMLISDRPVEKLLGGGKDVLVFVTPKGPLVIFVGGRIPHWPIIVCYIPVPEIWRRIDREIRAEIIERLFKDARLSERLAQDILGRTALRA